MKKKKFTYRGRTVSLSTDTYRNNGCLALILNYKNGEQDVISTNLNSRFQSSSMCFLDTNNFPTIEQFIQRNKLGWPMGVKVRSGFCEYPLYTIFTSAL